MIEDWQTTRLWALGAGVFTWLLVAATISLIVGGLGTPTWPQLLRLANHGRHATATVTAIDTGNHNTCTLTYNAGRQSLTAQLPCDASRPGQIQIVYDPGDPSVVDTGTHPGSDLRTSVLLMLLAATAFSLIVAFGVRRLQRWLTSSQQPR